MAETHSPIQIRFKAHGVRVMMRELNLDWIYEDYWDREWTNNLTRIIDSLEQWCKDAGIVNFSTGFTQIELCVTFKHKKDAMMFKLRWHDAQTA